MTDAPDARLLEQFIWNRSEEAFAALVQRHIALVHSVALRHTANPQHAEDITQAVFIILARRARTLGRRTVLPGWLYHTARLVAANWQRAETRRARREQEAFLQSSLNEPDLSHHSGAAADALWQELRPQLDEAMAVLGAGERDVLVLRYFQNKSMAEVGKFLGLAENTAQKRVSRALEKLRQFFFRRGVSSTTAVIAGVISAHSVQPAPAALAKTMTAAAMTKGAAASTSTLTLIKGALKIMAWTKAKTAIVVGVGVLLAAGTATISIKELASPAPFIRIEGKGQVELYNFHGQSRVVETGNLVILTDGKSYRISIVSEGHSGLTNDAYDMTAEYGCDGVDTFVLSDQPSFFHRTHEGFGGFAYPGRFPSGQEVDAAPSVVQAAWLAYCSKDYFNTPGKQTGLKLGTEFSMTWPDYVTNLVTYWPDSTLPQSITGWSRNWVIAPRTNSLQIKQAIELRQYPDGFKAWKFTASDPVTIGHMRVPRRFTLETFLPKPPDSATTGDDTEPLRKATFIADSVELGKGRIHPLPPVTNSDLQVIDERFKDIAGNFLIESHATPSGWPTRGSRAFNRAAAKARQIASHNRRFIQSDLKKEQTIAPP